MRKFLSLLSLALILNTANTVFASGDLLSDNLTEEQQLFLDTYVRESQSIFASNSPKLLRNNGIHWRIAANIQDSFTTCVNTGKEIENCITIAAKEVARYHYQFNYVEEAPINSEAALKAPYIKEILAEAAAALDYEKNK